MEDTEEGVFTRRYITAASFRRAHIPAGALTADGDFRDDLNVLFPGTSVSVREI